MTPHIRRDLAGLAQWAILIASVCLVMWLSSVGLTTMLKPAVAHHHDPSSCKECRELRETDRKAPGKIRYREDEQEEVSPAMFAK